MYTFFVYLHTFLISMTTQYARSKVWYVKIQGFVIPRHFLSLNLQHFHKNIRSWVENECCCPRTVNISNVNFTSNKFEGFDSCDRPSNLTHFGFKSSTFQPVWPWNLMDDLKKIIGHLFYTTSSFYIISNPSVNSNWSHSPERPIRVKIGNFISCVNLKFDGWPWKTVGRFFYATLTFVHHFEATHEFKLELQSVNAQFGSKSAIFCPVWPWNLMEYLKKQ